MAKVAIYSPSEKIWGGGQIYIDNLCRYLNLHDTTAKIFTSEPDSFLSPTATMPSVASKSNRLRSAFNVAKSLKKQNVKIVILNDLSSLWLTPVFRLYGLKIVSLLHLYLQRKNAAGHGHGWLEYHFLRFSSRFADHVFSVNKDNKKRFPVPVEFVGNFISSWFFDPQEFCTKQYDIGLISRLSDEKNVSLFVELIAQLNALSDRPINGLIVGKGPEESKVRESITQHGMQNCIELRPWVEREELPMVYDQLKCFAITSHHEGFATTLLEAHARGVPAISTRSAGYCAEFIEGEGNSTGLVFEPSELHSDSFLRSVLALVDNVASYSSLCRQKAMHFSEDKVLGRIQKGINGLLKD